MIHVTYIGHATLLIEMDGLRFLTDPLLTRFMGPLRRQWPPVDPAWIQDIDAVLLSHLHHDHYHQRSLSRLAADTGLIVPAGAGALFQSERLSIIGEVEPGDRLTIGPVEIQAVQADHKPSRLFTDVTAVPVGFMLRGSQNVYFAGDTDIFPEMADLEPAIDLVLIPIWGWGPTLGAGHLNPFRAAEALSLLKPRVAIPIHYGTYFPVALPWRRHVALRLPPLEFTNYAEQCAPDVEIRVLSPGDSTVVLPRSSD